MKILALSDTHCALEDVIIPEGDYDLLVHAGDLTYHGTEREITKQLKVLGEMAKKFKHGCVFICGNHDFLGERNPELMKKLAVDNGLTYLNDESVVIEGYKIHGSPISPFFYNWAFNRRESEIQKHWNLIPDDTQILITHGPPYGYGDRLDANGSQPFERIGCKLLLNTLKRLPKLRTHIFGHIHCGYGVYQYKDSVQMVNAAVLDERYKMRNKPVVIDL